MDLATIVTFIYEAGNELVERCELVKQCHSEATRIAVRTVRVMGSLEDASREFSRDAALNTSLIELKRVLQEARELVEVKRGVLCSLLRQSVDGFQLFVGTTPSFRIVPLRCFIHCRSQYSVRRERHVRHAACTSVFRVTGTKNALSDLSSFPCLLDPTVGGPKKWPDKVACSGKRTLYHLSRQHHYSIWWHYKYAVCHFTTYYGHFTGKEALTSRYRQRFIGSTLLNLCVVCVVHPETTGWKLRG